MVNQCADMFITPVQGIHPEDTLYQYNDYKSAPSFITLISCYLYERFLITS